MLQTDASSVGVGAILEQGGHVIAYTSRTLNQAEQQYNVILKECLAIGFALRQLRDFLSGRPFELMADHAPLQWLSSQKVEGLLCRWALAMKEFDFTIKYCEGFQNGNADALSRHVLSNPMVAATQFSTDSLKNSIQAAQQADPLYDTVKQSTERPTSQQWRQPPLSRYSKLWSQLKLRDEVLFWQYTPQPLGTTLTVPILPKSPKTSTTATMP